MKPDFEYIPTEEDKEIAELKRRYYELTEQSLLRNLRERNDRIYSANNKNPKIFVYTPTFNRAEILMQRALPSVLNQTYDNFEYLIVGDCCTDDTQEQLNSIKDERVRFFNIGRRNWRYPEKTQNHWLAGPAVAANTALMMVNGDWIARIDDDDVWVPDHLETMLRFAQEGNYEFVSGISKTIRHGEEVIPKAPHLYSDYFKLQDLAKEGVDNPQIGATSSILYRSYLSSFLYNTDCYRKDHNRNNDLDLYIRFGLAGVRMGYLDRVEFLCLPRPGEETIGSEAYISNTNKMVEHYKF